MRKLFGNLGKCRQHSIIGVELLAGIEFTMSICIAELSFPGNPYYLNIAKTGFMLSSMISAILGVGWFWSCSEPD
jgi:Na+/H+ antiporter NhaA